MKTTRQRIIAACLIGSLSILCLAGVKVSKLVRTTTVASNDLFIVVTGTTAKVTRHIQAHDLAVGLGPWITNAAAGGSATNAQPPSTILTNLSGTSAITNINEGNVLYVRTNGNDSTALRGRIDRPWGNASNAISSAVDGDVVKIGPGTYDNLKQLRPAHGKITIQGTGMGVTKLKSGDPLSAFGTFFNPGSSNIISNLTIEHKEGSELHFTFGARSGAGDRAFTNVFLENVELDGDTDGFFIDHSAPCSFEALNCRIRSQWDTFISRNNTNNLYTLQNCTFLADSAGTTNEQNSLFPAANGPTIEAGRLNLYNCRVVVTNSLDGTLIGSLGTAHSFVAARNSSFEAATTNAPTLMNSTLRVGEMFLDNCTPMLSVVTLGTNTYRSRWNDHLVMMPEPSSSSTLPTNKLPAMSYLAGIAGTAIEGAEFCVCDGVNTAAGTNVWVLTVDGAKINNGPTQTNINANSGCITFRVRGNNWIIVSKFP